jgi:hypothetical protein
MFTDASCSRELSLFQFVSSYLLFLDFTEKLRNQEKREFKKETSVFKDWKADTRETNKTMMLSDL